MAELRDESGDIHDVEPDADGKGECPLCNGILVLDEEGGYCQNCNEGFEET